MKVIDLLEGLKTPLSTDESDHFRWARLLAAKNDKESTVELQALSVRTHNIPAYKNNAPFTFSVLENPHAEHLPHLGELTSQCWRALGGFNDPERAKAAIRKARLQIQQAFFFDSMLDYFHLKSKTESLHPHQQKYISDLESSNVADPRFSDPLIHVPSSPFVGPVDIVSAWITESELATYRVALDRTPTNADETLRDALYAVALTWLDQAVAAGLGTHCTNLITIACRAMLVASIFDGLQLADKARKAASASHGLKGARIRHTKTDELKKWALDRAQGESQQPKALSRRLVHEIPQRLRNACNDPERLIYEAILAQRKSDQLRG